MNNVIAITLPLVEAVGTKVIVSKQQQENTTAGGIVLSVEKDMPVATLLSIGEEAQTKAPNLKEGQQLFVEWRNSMKLEHKGKTVYVLDVSSVYGIAL